MTLTSGNARIRSISFAGIGPVPLNLKMNLPLAIYLFRKALPFEIWSKAH